MSVEQWWARRQRVTGLVVPTQVGEHRDAWAPFTALVAQYRPERNGGLLLTQIPPAAEVYLVWVCSIGHEFVATPAEQRARAGRSRASRSWCPVCARPPLIPPAPRYPHLHNSGTGAARVPRARRDTPPTNPTTAESPELWRSAREVQPGQAFHSRFASRATSAAEGRLRSMLASRLELDLSSNAVRVARAFFGRVEVWPDVVVPELAIAVELDTVGRNGDEHVGRRESADRRKDHLLREVGWEVIRLRTRPLRPLGPYDLEIASVSVAAVDSLIERMSEARGPLLVEAYRR